MPLIKRVFVAASVAWAAALPSAALVAGPFQAPGPSVLSLLALATYAVGSLVCHQRPDRSFQLFAVQMPVCARCVGIYVGAAGAAVALAFRGFGSLGIVRTPARGAIPFGRMRTVLLASALPMAATMGYELVTGDAPGNWVRAVSGLPVGASVAWVVCSLM